MIVHEVLLHTSLHSGNQRSLTCRARIAAVDVRRHLQQAARRTRDIASADGIQGCISRWRTKTVVGRNNWRNLALRPEPRSISANNWVRPAGLTAEPWVEPCTTKSFFHLVFSQVSKTEPCRQETLTKRLHQLLRANHSASGDPQNH